MHEAQPDLRIVALTATPPYDVPTAEWKRFSSFCGPADAEITTPELVRAGHLCPHHDVVHLTSPEPDEQTNVEARRRDTVALAEDVLSGPVVDALRRHPWLADPASHVNAIADEDPDWFVAMLAMCTEAGHDVTEAGAVLGISHQDLPALQLSLVSHVLQGALGRLDEFEEADAAVIQGLRADLRRVGALHGRRVLLHQPPQVRAWLGRSTAKIESVAEIIAAESAHRQEGLRAVVLADRIQDDVWDPAFTGTPRLGVASLVSRLHGETDVPVGAVVGAFAVLPEASVPVIEREMANEIRVDVLEACPGLVRVTTTDGGSSLVAPMTRLFERGVVRVLVGTVALLGEGWDAPPANVLVSASYAATYVQTGQMRGRVLRIDPNRPGKVATIWHLACVETGAEEAGPDLDRLHRRFVAFAGPRAGDPPMLETGLDRLRLPQAPLSVGAIRESNQRSFARAASLDRVRDLWLESVGREADGQQLRPLVRFSREKTPLPPGLLLRRSRRLTRDRWGRVPEWMGGTGAMAAVSALGTVGGFAAPFVIAMWLSTIAMGGAGAAALWKYQAEQKRREGALGPVGVQVQVLADVVVESLRRTGVLPDRVGRGVVVRAYSGIAVRLDGGSPTDAEAFTFALAELLGHSRSPRYVLVFDGIPFPVPTDLGRRKDTAEIFLEVWSRRVGAADLVFTRTPAGRRRLAEARVRWARSRGEVEHIRQWA